MATRFYFHAANNTVSGTMPSSLQSTRSVAASIDAATSKRNMNTTIGTSQTSLATASAAVTWLNSGNVFVARFISDILAQTSIAANTWTINIGGAVNDGASYHPNANAASSTGQSMPVTVYVWRPSSGTKVANIIDGSSATFNGSSATTSEVASTTTFSGSAVTCQTGDVIVCELFVSYYNGNFNGGIYTNYFDGTTANTTNNATVSNHAAFIETPENISLGALGVTATVTGKAVTNKVIVHG